LSRRVYFVAIGGTGMGALAGLLANRGWQVSGSDHALYPPMSTALEQWGIRVEEGFEAGRIEAARPDLVVIGNAVRRDNPEAREAIDGGFSYRSFPQALYELAMADRHRVVVAGTHGKSTTTNLISHLLAGAGLDPSFLVGGISLDFGGSFRNGSGPHFVVEGDEYDTAFFEKTPKFWHYRAQTLVLTSVEFDHADIYRDLDHVKQAFREGVERMPEDGTIIAADHEQVREVVAGAPCRTLSYGFDENLDFSAADLESSTEGTRFRFAAPGHGRTDAFVPMHGRFNIENALAGLATAHVLGADREPTLAALGTLQGVKRRQELRGEVAGVAIIDDFAHHPTAVRGSLQALRDRYPGRRLLALFEPRTNTSRRAVFQERYGESFDAADRVFVMRVPDEPIYSATGEVGPRFSSDRFVEDLEKRGVPAEAFESVDALVDAVVRAHQSGDVILTLSNGAFGGVWQRLFEALERTR